MKKTISIILAITMMFSIAFSNPFLMDVVAADSGRTGHCTWSKNGTVLTISGNGAMADYSNTSESSMAPWGNSITKVIIEKGVTNIGVYAFEGCDSLSSVQIANTVTSIGGGAFSRCTSLVSIEIPDSVTSIGAYAFGNCTNLTDVEMPDSVTRIGDQAFSGCESLTNITIPDGITSIELEAFYGCVSLTNIEIPNSVTSMLYLAFGHCKSLTSVTIPKSVSSIDFFVFSECSMLKDIWYLGTQSDKNNMEIYRGNEYLLSATWHYNTCENNNHVYSAECDMSCNNCEWIRDIVTDVTESHRMTLNGGLTCQFCGLSQKPVKPELQSRTMETVTLLYKEWLEYSKDGETWQDSTVFTGLDENTAYTFYQRVKATSTSLVSEKSDGLVVCTKSSQIAPNPPVISSCTDTTVTLQELIQGEYSIDGITWQTSNVFDGLSPGTEYTFYQRYVETDTHGASAPSAETTVTTDKSQQTLIPKAPVVQNVTTSSITLVLVDGCEYSIDGITWQLSNVFGNLSCNTEYTFYQRYKETSSTYVGKSSEGTIGKTNKEAQSAPSKPTVFNYTDTSVTLLPVEGVEYSLDGITWQSSNVFTGLSSGTKYTFYQRYVETDTHEASASSAGTYVTTDKSKQTLIPNAPVVQSVTASSITLKAVDGCEYSKNGTTWQSSNVFSSLSCGTEYTFYQRYKETSSTYVGKSSEGTVGKTDKGTQSAPSKPTLSKKTHNSVTLAEKSGYEYSVDGITWQTSNVFTELSPETNYLFYQRKAENDKYYASGASDSLTVKTDEEPTYVVGDLDGDGELSDWDGVMLARYLAGWQVEISVLETLDIDGDGEVSDWDGVILDRYLAGWNIQIGGQQ